MRQLIPIFALLLITLCSCDNTHPEDIVLSDATPKLLIRNKSVFTYNQNLCQLACNKQEASFRMMTDDMSEYVAVKLNRIPSTEGENVQATELIWTTPDDLEIRKKITLEVLQLKGDVIWLWYSREQIALVLQILE